MAIYKIINNYISIFKSSQKLYFDKFTVTSKDISKCINDLNTINITFIFII